MEAVTIAAVQSITGGTSTSAGAGSGAGSGSGEDGSSGGDPPDDTDEEEEDTDDDESDTTPGPSAEYRDRNEATDEEAKSGCACVVGAQESAPTWPLLILGLVAGMRRQRRP